MTPIGIYGLTAGVQAISAGSTHDCALTTAGGVKCWGHNDFGELGDGSNAGGPYPVDVSGLSSGVQAIGAGGDDAGNGLGAHTCALLVDGAVKCWGHNFVGEVGDGTTTDRFAPADVSGLSSGVQAISVGGEHTCALLTSGGVSCWGDNFVGEIGDGTDVDRHVPTAVRWPVPKITKVSPKKAKAGTTVLTITGTDLLSTSGVTFNGLPSASFTAASQTTVTALVPAGAKTGKVVVTTADGAAKSPRKLKIK